MTFEKTLLIPSRMVQQLKKLIEGPAEDCGRDEVIFDEEVIFDDGVRMAIQVCAPNEVETEGCWVQGVLFTSDGHELGCTGADDSILGEYNIECDNNEYVCHVIEQVNEIPDFCL